MHKRCAPRIETYLFKQALDCFGPYFGTGNCPAESVHSPSGQVTMQIPALPLQGREACIARRFSRCKGFLYPDMHFTFHPLDGQANALRDASSCRDI